MTSIDKDFLALERVRVIEEFDGPLLVLYKNAKGALYLEMWVDMNGDRDFWFVFRVEEKMLSLYEQAAKTLRDLLLNTPDCFVFKRETEKGETVSLDIVKVPDIPEEYIPLEGSYIDGDPVTTLLFERK